FSSRRRHTRSYGDWSSDVCSSDLIELELTVWIKDPALGEADVRQEVAAHVGLAQRRILDPHRQLELDPVVRELLHASRGGRIFEIGRASCRQRAELRRRDRGVEEK